ncbi:hypothetical protein BHE74_00058682, partial [Ensete ventricosum]
NRKRTNSRGHTKSNCLLPNCGALFLEQGQDGLPCTVSRLTLCNKEVSGACCRRCCRSPFRLGRPNRRIPVLEGGGKGGERDSCVSDTYGARGRNHVLEATTPPLRSPSSPSLSPALPALSAEHFAGRCNRVTRSVEKN